MTVFALQALIRFEDCDLRDDVTALAVATTSYKIPKPVRNARVVGNTTCIIEWEHDEDYEPNILKYKVSY